jgi:hypothetical protein
VRRFAAATIEVTPGDAHVTLHTAAVSLAEAVFRVTEEVEATPALTKPAPGDPAQTRQ